MLIIKLKLLHFFVVTSWNHCFWGLSKQAGLSSTQMHIFVTILDEVGDSLSKHRLWPCSSMVPKWRLEADKVFHELCLLLQSFERLSGDPSPIVFMHLLIATSFISCPSWLHLLWSSQSPSSSSWFLFTFTHCPLSGWYIIYGSSWNLSLGLQLIKHALIITNLLYSLRKYLVCKIQNIYLGLYVNVTVQKVHNFSFWQ